MDITLEDKRSLHEERDRIELAVVNEILSKKQGHKDKLDSEHRQKILIDRYMRCSKTLHNLYSKKTPDIPDDRRNPFDGFYISLKKIKDTYAKNSNEQAVTLASEFEAIEAARQIAMGAKAKPNPDDKAVMSRIKGDDDDFDEDESSHDPHAIDREGEIQRLTRGLPTTDLVEISEPQVIPETTTITEKLVDFTDEEGYGRYFDLIKCHEAFLQVLKKEEVKPNYLTFLDKFDRFADIDRNTKLTMGYKIYVDTLLDYFRDYCRRAKPLLDYRDMESRVEEGFQDLWDKKQFPGWFTDSERNMANQLQMVDIETYRCHEELMELGMDCLKRELQVRGLKCGGTLEERAKRLWLVRGKADDEIDDSLRAAPVVSKKGKKKTTIDPRSIALAEAKITMYAEYFIDHRQATIENVQRKQARTAEERNESDEDSSELDDDDDEDNDIVYNPKNLPLGWDGKPIPYWLYKLHGLNITFNCEICGNATYKGPKTFQRHFAEWRHAHGMRCLGIPNTAHFANITSIQDAIKLWEKLKAERQRNKSQPSNDEEYEDSQGNVVNRKTYEDLKRQGLL